MFLFYLLLFILWLVLFIISFFFWPYKLCLALLMYVSSVSADGHVTIKTTFPATITSWVASAFAVNKVSGLGIAPTSAKVCIKVRWCVSKLCKKNQFIYKLYLKLWLPVWFTDTYDNVYHIYRSIVLFDFNKLENTEGAIKKRTIQKTWQHIYIWHTKRRKTKHNMCWTPLYANYKHK